MDPSTLIGSFCAGNMSGVYEVAESIKLDFGAITDSSQTWKFAYSINSMKVNICKYNYSGAKIKILILRNYPRMNSFQQTIDIHLEYSYTYPAPIHPHTSIYV